MTDARHWQHLQTLLSEAERCDNWGVVARDMLTASLSNWRGAYVEVKPRKLRGDKKGKK